MEDKNHDEEVLVNPIGKEIEFSGSIEESRTPSTLRELESTQQVHSKRSMGHL